MGCSSSILLSSVWSFREYAWFLLLITGAELKSTACWLWKQLNTQCTSKAPHYISVCPKCTLVYLSYENTVIVKNQGCEVWNAEHSYYCQECICDFMQDCAVRMDIHGKGSIKREKKMTPLKYHWVCIQESVDVFLSTILYFILISCPPHLFYIQRKT